MKMGVLHVTTTKQPPYRAKIRICSPCLADMGFVHGAAVRAAPRQDGFNLALQNENNAREDGKLIHVSLYRDKPNLTVNLAQNFPTGLIDGDFLAAGYEYGIIRARKLPEAQKYYVITSQNYGAFLQFSGAWLSDTGFTPDTITTVSSTHEGIMFSAWKDIAAKYDDIVKYARKQGYQIIQARRNQHITTMDIPGYILNKAGFGNGDIIGVRYEYGIIKLFKPDLQRLGFILPAA